jgi:hypothetical protein
MAQPAEDIRIAVLGSARLERGTPEWDLTFRVGQLLAGEGWIVVTGGYAGSRCSSSGISYHFTRSPIGARVLQPADFLTFVISSEHVAEPRRKLQISFSGPCYPQSGGWLLALRFSPDCQGGPASVGKFLRADSAARKRSGLLRAYRGTQCRSQPERNRDIRYGAVA